VRRREEVQDVFLSLPNTKLGWWSVGLSASFLILFIVNAAVLLPAPGVVPWREATVGIVLLLCGIGGGVAAVFALIRVRDRSWLVWLAMLPAVCVLFMTENSWRPCFSSDRRVLASPFG
jgi:hypothetical protein